MSTPSRNRLTSRWRPRSSDPFLWHIANPWPIRSPTPFVSTRRRSCRQGFVPVNRPCQEKRARRLQLREYNDERISIGHAEREGGEGMSSNASSTDSDDTLASAHRPCSVFARKTRTDRQRRHIELLQPRPACRQNCRPEGWSTTWAAASIVPCWLHTRAKLVRFQLVRAHRRQLQIRYRLDLCDLLCIRHVPGRSVMEIAQTVVGKPTDRIGPCRHAALAIPSPCRPAYLVSAQRECHWCLPILPVWHRLPPWEENLGPFGCSCRTAAECRHRNSTCTDCLTPMPLLLPAVSRSAALLSHSPALAPELPLEYVIEPALAQRRAHLAVQRASRRSS